MPPFSRAARTRIPFDFSMNESQLLVTDTPLQPLVFEQLKAIGLTLVLAIAGTTVIAYIVKALVGLRPSEEVETAGLDLAEHGEEGYHG
jgi:ammonia channel protein AmtB